MKRRFFIFSGLFLFIILSLVGIKIYALKFNNQPYTTKVVRISPITIPINSPTNTPTIIIIVTPPPTKIPIKPAYTFTPTPNQTQTEECKRNLPNLDYFKGLYCYEDYFKTTQNNPLIKPASADELSDKLNRTTQAQTELLKKAESELITQCLKYTIIIFQQCNESLNKNIEKLKNQIFNKYSSDLNICLSKVAEGDQNRKETNKNYFWKAKLTDNIPQIYDYCFTHNNNIDGINL